MIFTGPSTTCQAPRLGSCLSPPPMTLLCFGIWRLTTAYARWWDSHMGQSCPTSCLEKRLLSQYSRYFNSFPIAGTPRMTVSSICHEFCFHYHEVACCLATQDGTIWFWETASRHVLQKSMLPSNISTTPFAAATCSPDGCLLVTGTSAPVLMVWSFQGGPGAQMLGTFQYIVHLPQSAGSAVRIEFMADSLTVAGLDPFSLLALPESST